MGNEKLIKIILGIVIVINVKVVNSQDIHFSQFYNNPIQLNPAMSGLAFGPRLILNYRNQYPSIGNGSESGYTTYSISYDQHFEKINSGFGFVALMDRTANGIYNKYNLQLTYAYQIRVSRNLGIKIGVYGGLSSVNLDWQKLKFYDQIDPIDGFFGNLATMENQPVTTSQHQFDAGFGLLFFNKKFYGGITARHLTFQKNSFYSNNISTLLPLYLGAHFGGNIMLSKNKKIYLAPNLNYGFQYKRQELLPVLLFNYELVNFGTGVRYTFNELESIIFYLGISKGIVRFNYSYDHTMSALNGLTGGGHEVSLRFLFGGDDNSLRPKSMNGIIDCPDILRQ